MVATTANTMRLRLSPKQAEFLLAPEPWVALVAGRGAGKTFVGGWFCYTVSHENPGTVGLITANSYKQLTQATLKPLFAMMQERKIEYEWNRAPKWFDSPFKKHDGIISFPNGSQIVTRSLENYDDIRGSEFGWAWCDEVRDTAREAWMVMIATLRGKGPRKLRVTTTPNGYDHVYESFEDEPRAKPSLRDKRKLIKTSTYDNMANLGRDFVEMLEASYDEEFARQEIYGEFINVGQGLVYPTFDRHVHVDPSIEYDPRLPLQLSCDFNVTPMCWVVSQTIRGRDVVIDEVVRQRPRVGMSPTESAALDFVERYANHQAGIVVFGDYYGTSRNTATSRTDYDVLMQALQGASKSWIVLNVSSDIGGNPPVVDRIRTVNARFRNARREVNLWLHPKCETLIKDLERVSYKESAVKREIDKTTDKTLTHASDALGYWLYSLYGREGAGIGVGSTPERDRDVYDEWHEGREADVFS